MNKFAAYTPRAIELNELCSLVENRRVYALKNCELNVYETYQSAENVSVKFDDLVITSMLRGKKIMHGLDDSVFDYVPGQSLLWQANKPMVIDFPDATTDNPTQCVALTISKDEIRETIHFLNRKYPKMEDGGDWKLNMDEFLLFNSKDFTDAINKIVAVSMDDSRMKDAFAELALRELLLKLMQTQARQFVEAHYEEMAGHNRLAAVIKHIQENIHHKISVDELCRKVYMSRSTFFRLFKRELGITPVEYIIREKMKLAKEILLNSRLSINTVAFQCGFDNVNHFIKTFRYFEKITPLQFKKLHTNQHSVEA
jgi:AraC-like DNA-binding protein